MKKSAALSYGLLFSLLIVIVLAFLISSCASSAGSAEEYYSIGMAYYDLGKFTEAERWLLRAVATDKTMTASEYNLGRIAFETGRYQDASDHFENILKRDPNNVMALKSAAYTKIRMNDLPNAESLYGRVLALVPESSDDGYNYAVVLYAMEKYDECQAVLQRYPVALDEKPDSLLLLARAQSAAERVEAADNYAKWIAASTTPNPKVLYEYGQVLEKTELYALALEQYRACLAALRTDQPDLERNRVQFNIARLLLIADPGNAEGITELNSAIVEGFKDSAALQELLDDSRIDSDQKTDISQILENLSTALPE